MTEDITKIFDTDDEETKQLKRQLSYAKERSQSIKLMNVELMRKADKKSEEVAEKTGTNTKRFNNYKCVLVSQNFSKSDGVSTSTPPVAEFYETKTGYHKITIETDSTEHLLIAIFLEVANRGMQSVVVITGEYSNREYLQGRISRQDAYEMTTARMKIALKPIKNPYYKEDESGKFQDYFQFDENFKRQVQETHLLASPWHKCQICFYSEKAQRYFVYNLAAVEPIPSKLDMFKLFQKQEQETKEEDLATLDANYTKLKEKLKSQNLL